MKQMKKRLALFLCLLMTVPTILGCLPMASLKADAASVPTSTYIGWNIPYVYNPAGTSFEVEANKQVLVGRLVRYQISGGTYKSGYLSQVKGVTYKSSNTAVASFDSKGKLTTKKAGTTNVTVTYKGKLLTCSVKVVKAGTHKASGSKYMKVKDLAQKLSSYTKVTADNRYKISELQGQLMHAQENLVSAAGFKMEKAKGNSYFSNTNKLILPELLEYDTELINSKIQEYTAKDNPVGTVASKCFKIKSISAKKNSRSFTITLKSKANATQIFKIKKYYSSDKVIKNDKRAVFPIYLKDTNTGYTYYGRAVATEKSNKITVSMDYHKLKAGTKYAVIGDLRWRGDTKGWTQGKAFTVKK